MDIQTREIDVELQNVTKKFNTVPVVDNISLQIRNGEFFSLLGPSGCGKTTTLRMIAGFELLTSGEIFIKGKPQGFLPPFQRPVNTVFQQYALFPHMTVFQNVGFGLEMKKIPKAEITRRVGEALELVHLTGMENRKPRQLSGGQQQRVALARALINRPQVLLLDEPLGALDLKLRKAMQIELKNLQEEVGITFIYVTHDQEEALTMSDRIAVMNHGHVLQLGTSTEIYENPTSKFVADFIGETNFISGKVARTGSQLEIRTLGDKALTGGWAEPDLSHNDDIVISIRPEKMHVHPSNEAPPMTDGTNQVTGTVDNIIFHGVFTGYLINIGESAPLIAHVQNTGLNAYSFDWDDQVTVSWNIKHARILRA